MPRAHRLILPFAALLAILPMLRLGPSCGHDFDFHLLSWLEASTQIAHGGYPHWAFTPAFNAGEPRFLFYPPLSWLLGALLGLILPWQAVPIAFVWVCLTLSGFTAYRLAHRFANEGIALIAATLYLANPYMLFCAYERSAFGELLAAAWMPLLFAAMLAPTMRSWRDRIVPLATPIALLWLTNAPAAVMGCYALALVTLVRLIRPSISRVAPASKSKRLALTTLAGTALGLLLPAFYLLPAAYERRYIQSEMAIIGGMRIADNTLFHHMTPATPDTLFHDQVLHTASLIALTLLGMIVLAIGWPILARRWRRGGVRPRFAEVPASLFILTAILAFLLTPWSLALWTHTPQLLYLQFPWRFSALLATILVIAAARALSALRLPPLHLAPIAAIVLAAALILPGWRLFHQHCFDEDTVEARTALFHSPLGTEATDEYTPTEADPDQLHPHDPPYWLLPADAEPDAPAPNTPPGAASDITTPAEQAFADHAGQAPRHLELNLPSAEILVLNRRVYPAWRVVLNGHPTALLSREDGLIALALPAGHDVLDVTFIRTPDRTYGLLLSLLALAIFVLLAGRD